MFSVTAEAISFFKTSLRDRNTPNVAIRLGVSGSGCNGYAYHLQFEDNEPRERDHVFEFEGLKIIIDKKSFLFLQEATVDYQKTLLESGIKIINPIEKSKCGCGSSFSV